jgi:hypothetical protein
MMSVSLEKSVAKTDNGRWSFQCPGFSDSRCGDLDTGQPFHSDDWPTKALAIARGRQHFTEHAFPDKVTPSLEEFRREHNLTVDADGMAQVADLAQIVED